MKGNNAATIGQCLPDQTLTDYLDGTLEPVVQTTCEAHLIACDPCRAKLAQYMRMLNPEVTPEEVVLVQETADVWNRRYGHLAPSVRHRSIRRRMWIVAAAAALVLLIGGTARMTLRWMNSTPSAHELVQAILTKDRPFPAQLADEPHVPMLRSEEEGAGINLDSLSAEMSKQAASQYDAGRFQLIQKHFPEAIAALEAAAKDTNATPAVHNDLGVAYMEQRGTDNLVKAEKEFNRALQRDSRFAPAVFNLSILYDRAGMPDKANQERKIYLELDSISGWADEVRLKLTR